MKVSELIETLSKLDPNLVVFVNGYEGGYSDICADEFIIDTFKTDVYDDWYYGPHEKDENGDVKGIVIR